jgi:hypothetical protein
MNDIFIHGDPLEDLPRFRTLPKELNGHRLFYKGDAPSAKETKEEQALAEVAQKKWQYYQDNYRPLEDEYMKQVDNLDSEGAYDFAGGTAASATTAAFAGARENMAEDMRSAGVNPNSGKYKSGMAGLADAEAMSSADGKSRALTSQQDEYVTGVSNVSAIGRGQSTSAQAGLSDLAQSANTKAASDAGNAWNNKAATTSAAGGLFGAGLHEFTKEEAK